MAKAGILGTGLIGASIGLGLRRAGWRVLGWDPDPATALEAAERDALTDLAGSEADVTGAGIDLLVLAGPPRTVPDTLRRLDTGTLVTDVTGVKGPVVDAGAHLPRFVSSHPLAGREMTGPAAASGSLFQGATWIVVTDGATHRDMLELESVIRLLGANPLRMSAEEHDRTITVVSHLPQVLATTLITEAADEIGDLSLAGGGLRDLTRIAGSDPTLWSELLTTNRPLAAEALRRFADRLEAWAGLLDDPDSLHGLLARAAGLHANLHAHVGTVEVALLDRPGELAAVGRALDHAGVDVRDLQMRHAPHGGGGLLQIYVRHDDVASVRKALETEDLTVTRTGGGNS